MKKIIITTIILLSYKLIFSQVDYTKIYYKNINNAELEITKNNFQIALDYYMVAFNSVSRPFARDYFNATICAVKLEKNKIAFNFCDSLIRKGVTKDFFLENDGLTSLREDEKWNSFITTFDKKYVRLNKDKNLILKEKYEEFHRKDQEFRIKKGSYKVYGDTIKKIDSLNIKELIVLIEKYGFPNENLVGIDSPTRYNFPAYIVFHHHCQKMSLNKVSYNFRPTFIEAIKIGELDPHKGFKLIALQNGKDSRLGAFGIIKLKTDSIESKLLASKIKQADKEEINTKRIKYGLENLNDFYKKGKWGIENKATSKFAFTPFTFLNTFMIQNEQYDNFLKKFEEIN